MFLQFVGVVGSERWDFKKPKNKTLLDKCFIFLSCDFFVFEVQFVHNLDNSNLVEFKDAEHLYK